MGLFDYVICRAKLPGDPPAFVLQPDFRFQTKDLDCYLQTYEIGEYLTKDGVAVEDVIALEFYNSNIVASGPGLYTRDGEDAIEIDYQAAFEPGGKLLSIRELRRITKPALSVSEFFTREKDDEPELIENIELVRQEDMIGSKMFLHYGDDFAGYPVVIVAAGQDQWCVQKEDSDLQLVHRTSLGTCLFQSEAQAKIFEMRRRAIRNTEKARYDALLPARQHKMEPEIL